MSVSHMSPSWTRIHVQTRFHRVNIVINTWPITKPSWSRTSVVLLVKLGNLSHPGPYQGPAPIPRLPLGPHHMGHVPLGADHEWGGRNPTWSRIALLFWVSNLDPTRRTVRVLLGVRAPHVWAALRGVCPTWWVPGGCLGLGARP